MRRSRMIPDSVQFSLPEHGQDARHPPPGYEHGMTLNADYLEAMLWPKQTGKGYYYLSPRGENLIIEKFSLNGHDWKEFFFYVRINSSSVEESCISMFKNEWGKKVTGLISLKPEDLKEVGNLLLGSSRPRRRGLRKRLRFINKALSASNENTHMAKYKAEVAEREAAQLREEINANFLSAQELAEREVARMRDEDEAESCRVTELSDKRVCRAHREGKREIVEMMKVHRDRFTTEYSGVQDVHRSIGDYRECCGVLGGLHLTQSAVCLVVYTLFVYKAVC